MRKQIALSLVALVLLLFTYGLGYWGGFSHAGKAVPRIVERDASDSQQYSQQSSAKTVYEPYFTKQNPIPDGVR